MAGLRIGLATLLVAEYDAAIAFFTGLGFALETDVPMPSSRRPGGTKRWVVVRPPGGGAGLVLARAEGAEERARIGTQTGGRVGFFLQTDDMDATRAAFEARGVAFAGPVRDEPYGRVCVFRDVSGNLWDLIEPA